MTDPITKHYASDGSVMTQPHGNNLYNINFTGVDSVTGNYHFMHHGTNQSLYYDVTTTKWHDNSTDDPVGIGSSYNGSFISFTNGEIFNSVDLFFTDSAGNCIGGIENPFYVSSGGGGVSGNVSGPSGSINRFGSSITWTIDATSPSASASDSYYLKLDNIIYHNYGITHSNGSPTVQTIPTQVGTWKLWHVDQNGGTLLDELTVSQLQTPGRAFCNFW